MKVLKNDNEIQESCNCRNKKNCSLDEKCVTPNIIYKAQFTSNQLKYNQKNYIRTTEVDFKQWFNSNTKLFNIEHYDSHTDLSKQYWAKNRHDVTPKVTWRIIRKCTHFNTSKRKCYLCLNEHFYFVIPFFEVNLWLILSSRFHNKTNSYAGCTSVMNTFPWYFITQKFCFNHTIKFSYFSFYVFFIINRHAMKFLMS